MSTKRLVANIIILFLLIVSSSNAFAVSPRIPYYYDPVSHSMLKTFVPQRPAGMDSAVLPPQAVLGTRPCITILLEFSDNLANKTAHPASAYDNLLFSTGVIPTGSMKEFYDEVSYNQFSVTGQVTAWVTAPQTYAYYVGGNYGWNAYPANAQGMAYDACALIDPTTDFSLFDSDGPDGIPNSGDDDGFVDGLFIVHAGPGAEDTGNVNDIWSHKWQIPGAYTTNDAKFGGGFIRCYIYSTEPEEFADGSMQTVGVFAHEFCHVIGMPDLYYYDSGYINMWDDDNRPLFDWCLMSHGSWGGPTPWGDGSVPAHPSAWIKYMLGWITPTTLSSSGQYIPINEIEMTNGSTSLYKIPIIDYGFAEEYFLVANRDPNSPAMFDKYNNNGYFTQTLKDAGIVIYHIDERYPANDNGPVDPHYCVWTEDPGMVPVDTALTTHVEAPHYQLKSDAAYSLEDGQVDFNLNTGQPYHYCYPNSHSNDGALSGIAIRVLSNSGSSMMFHLGIGSEAEVTAPPAQACDPGNSIDLIFTVRNPGGYNEVYDLTSTSGHSFPLVHNATTGSIPPFGEENVTVTLTVPSGYEWPTYDYVTLRATSQLDPSVWDEAATYSPVAVAISSFEAIAGQGEVELQSEFSGDIAIKRVNIYRALDGSDPLFLTSVEGVSGSKFSYFDRDVEPGLTYLYQIGFVDGDGEFRSHLTKVTLPVGKVTLDRNYPNPFNPSTNIRFSLPKAQHATLDIYDVQGRLVRHLFDKVGLKGANVVQWDGINENGSQVSSGVYFYRLVSGKEFRETKKMILLR